MKNYTFLFISVGVFSWNSIIKQIQPGIPYIKKYYEYVEAGINFECFFFSNAKWDNS